MAPEVDVAPEADVARRTRKDATRHARPRGRACEAHATRRWRGHVAGGHAGPRGRLGGATWQGWQVKGPRVGGPW